VVYSILSILNDPHCGLSSSQIIRQLVDLILNEEGALSKCFCFVKGKKVKLAHLI